jgi:signal recognition particle subunit SRP14
VKLVTVVDAAELDAFFARYAEVCKKGMEGLRKRDKKKAKVKAKAKKKGKGGAGVGKATG